ncbi:MAG TPA: polymer-forming cytoskeletal protein [Candidatus Saccharimonadales bacterium]|nr:polymer-forming cytoskeletal protein [Candidatus Saccharimonadales bacterium]
MAKKTDVFNVASIDTVIGSGVRLKGNLSSDGDIAIDGALVGNIKSGGHVTIGVNGRIVGHIQGATVQIAGRVEGNVIALDSISLMETAQVTGDITTTHLEIGMGAIFIGTSKMKPAEATELSSATDTETTES